MKQLILTLTLTLACLLTFPSQSFAQDIPEDEVGDEIVIINQDLIGNGPARDIVPISATLFRLSGYVEVGFLSYLGVVTITLNNLTTGGTATMQINSTFGEAVIPVSLGAGNYRIDFCSSYSNYYGYFAIL